MRVSVRPSTLNPRQDCTSSSCCSVRGAIDSSAIDEPAAAGGVASCHRDESSIRNLQISGVCHGIRVKQKLIIKSVRVRTRHLKSEALTIKRSLSSVIDEPAAVSGAASCHRDESSIRNVDCSPLRHGIRAKQKLIP